MTNDFSGLITSEFKALHTDAITALLEDGALSRKCRLIYGGTQITECPNCILDLTTGRSSGRYQAGGPQEFGDGQMCPYCGNKGKIESEAEEENIFLCITWESNDWMSTAGHGRTAQTADMDLQTLSVYGLTYQKLLRVKYIIIDINIEGVSQQKFERVGKPEFAGLGSAEFVFFNWKRIN